MKQFSRSKFAIRRNHTEYHLQGNVLMDQYSSSESAKPLQNSNEKGNVTVSNSTACQVFDSYVRSSNYALLAITELPNNELSGIHTLSLSPLLL